MSESPSESTLKSRRRRKPIFIDEPIQWHRRNADLDRCPWCGLQTLKRRGPRNRICNNTVCGLQVENTLNGEEWLKCKLRGGIPKIMQSAPPKVARYLPHERYTLNEAQIRSKTGRGWIRMTNLSVGMAVSPRVFWHRRAHLPEDYNGNRVCAAGSRFWVMLLYLKDEPVWAPHDPLCAMEVLARAANDDPMFAILAP